MKLSSILRRSTVLQNTEFYFISLIKYGLGAAFSILIYMASENPTKEIILLSMGIVIAMLLLKPLFMVRETQLCMTIRFRALEILFKDISKRINLFTSFNSYSRSAINYLYISQSIAGITAAFVLTLACVYLELYTLIASALLICATYFIFSTILSKTIGNLFSKRTKLEQERASYVYGIFRGDNSRVNDLSLSKLHSSLADVREREHRLLRRRGFFTSIQSTIDLLLSVSVVVFPFILFEDISIETGITFALLASIYITIVQDISENYRVIRYSNIELDSSSEHSVTSEDASLIGLPLAGKSLNDLSANLPKEVADKMNMILSSIGIVHSDEDYIRELSTFSFGERQRISYLIIKLMGYNIGEDDLLGVDDSSRRTIAEELKGGR